MIRKINAQQLSIKYEQFEDLKPVDVRAFDDYEKGHLPRALSLPLEQIQVRVRQNLPDHGFEIVIYDEGANTERAWRAAHDLQALGYLEIFVYEGGIRDWREKELAIAIHTPQSPGLTNPTFASIIEPHLPEELNLADPTYHRHDMDPNVRYWEVGACRI